MVNYIDINLKGKWKQCHGDNDFLYSAIVEEESITVYIIENDEKNIYWARTFNTFVDLEKENLIESKLKANLVRDSKTASKHENKIFKYENGRLSFETNYRPGLPQTIVLINEKKII